MKALFLDRDGVVNKERGDYTYKIEDFHIIPNIISVIGQIKSLGFKIIIITNQSGISQNIYSQSDVNSCHEYLQLISNNLIDAFYVAPLNPSQSRSLSRKPDSLLFEKAIYKHKIDPRKSWMVGDKERDLIPAKKLGISTILLGEEETAYADYQAKSNLEFLDIVKSRIS